MCFNLHRVFFSRSAIQLLNQTEEAQSPFYFVMMSSGFALHCGLTFNLATPSDRRILHMVGVACVLGFGASFAQLPGSSSQQELISSDFTSRSLLWTTDDSGIRVSLVRCPIRMKSRLPLAVCNFYFAP